ncbi:MAG: nicotinamide riboside transporter PnuC [Bacteroidota bacterium]
MNWIIDNYIEIIASLLGIAGVFLTARQNIWCWPIGLVNVILSLYVFFVSKLYADVVLQVFYLVMTLYGWYFWVFGGVKKYELPIRRLVKNELIMMLLFGFGISFGLGWLFATYTDAAFPYWDSLVTVWGIIATYAMAKKILEHWIMWMLIDLNCTAIYFCKQLYAFSPLYFIFTLLAIYGYLKWRKNFKQQNITS